MKSTYLAPCREMQCNTYSLGGVIRSTIYDKILVDKTAEGDDTGLDISGQKTVKTKTKERKKATHNKSKLKLSVAQRKEVDRRKELLRMGMKPVCVFDTSDPEGTLTSTPHTVTIPQYPIIVISLLTNILSEEFKRQQSTMSGGTKTIQFAETTRELAQFTYDVARAYAEMYRIKSLMVTYDSSSNSGGGELQRELQTIHHKITEAIDTSMKFWDDAGQVLCP